MTSTNSSSAAVASISMTHGARYAPTTCSRSSTHPAPLVPKRRRAHPRHLLAVIRASTPAADHAGRLISYLPSAHIADRLLSHYWASTCFGLEVTSVADIGEIAGALAQVQPTVLGAVPRVWEKIMAALQAGGVTDPASMPEEARAAVRARIGLGQAEWSAARRRSPKRCCASTSISGCRSARSGYMSEGSAVSTCTPPTISASARWARRCRGLRPGCSMTVRFWSGATR